MHATAIDLVHASVVVPPPSMRSKVTVVGANGNEIEVPRGCPVPPHLIKGTWCDWADGWYLYLRKGLPIEMIREQPGELFKEYRHSHGWLQSLRPGWHAFTSEKKPVGSFFPGVPVEYPPLDHLYELWARVLDSYDEMAEASDRG